MSEALEGAQRAQERVWALQREGTAPNSPEGRQAVNHLMTRLRHLSEEELPAFEAWRDGEGQDSRPSA